MAHSKVSGEGEMSKPINVGKCLRIAQEKSGVTSNDIMKEMGVVRQQVSRWRQVENMHLHRIQQLAEICGMSVCEFISLDS